MLVLTNRNLKSNLKPYIEVTASKKYLTDSTITDHFKSIRKPITAINLSKARLICEVLVDCFKIILVDARAYDGKY